MRVVFCLLLAFFLAGCGGGEGKGEVVPLEKVPPELMKVAREKLPEVKFDHARRMPNGDWEIRGKGKNGKIREVELSPTGEVIEIE